MPFPPAYTLAGRLVGLALPSALGLALAAPPAGTVTVAYPPPPSPSSATASGSVHDTPRLADLAVLLASGTVTDDAVPRRGAGAGPLADRRGNPRAYSFLSQGGDRNAPIARWNPCAGPIRYRVNLTNAHKGALKDVKAAVGQVSAASGLRFRYLGATRVFPNAKRGYRGTYPRDTDLIIAWAVPGRHSKSLPRPPRGNRGPAGVGGGSMVPAYTRSGRPAAMMVRGTVVLDATLKLPGGFGKPPRYGWQATRGQLLMHEIGHAVGLGHPRINDQRQIMYPMLTSKRAVWGAGDRNGLRIVGSRSGCLYQKRPDAAVAPDTGPTTSPTPMTYSLPTVLTPAKGFTLP